MAAWPLAQIAEKLELDVHKLIHANRNSNLGPKLGPKSKFFEQTELVIPPSRKPKKQRLQAVATVEEKMTAERSDEQGNPSPRYRWTQ